MLVGCSCLEGGGTPPCSNAANLKNLNLWSVAPSSAHLRAMLKGFYDPEGEETLDIFCQAVIFGHLKC